MALVSSCDLFCAARFVTDVLSVNHHNCKSPFNLFCLRQFLFFEVEFRVKVLAPVKIVGLDNILQRSWFGLPHIGGHN